MEKKINRQIEDRLFPLDRAMLLDGATGTNLIASGMKLSQINCVEQWIIDHPRQLIDLQKAYIAAGSDAIIAPTFGANRQRLQQHGITDVVGMNLALVALSQQAVKESKCHSVKIVGDLSPTGLMNQKVEGALRTEIYDEQAIALQNAGCHFILAETMMDFADASAAVVASCKAGLPVIASFSLSGYAYMKGNQSIAEIESDLLADLQALAELGAVAVGLNCSLGEETARFFEKNKTVLSRLSVPLIAKPNAGPPGNTQSPEVFVSSIETLLDLGVSIVGGCCGTTPEHISALKQLSQISR